MQAARQAVVDYLKKFEGSRQDLLRFLSNKALRKPAILDVPSEGLAASGF